MVMVNISVVIIVIAGTFAMLGVNSAKQSDTGCHSERSEESK